MIVSPAIIAVKISLSKNTENVFFKNDFPIRSDCFYIRLKGGSKKSFYFFLNGANINKVPNNTPYLGGFDNYLMIKIKETCQEITKIAPGVVNDAQ